jgi:hypothetical protein
MLRFHFHPTSEQHKGATDKNTTTNSIQSKKKVNLLVRRPVAARILSHSLLFIIILAIASRRGVRHDDGVLVHGVSG